MGVGWCGVNGKYYDAVRLVRCGVARAVGCGEIDEKKYSTILKILLDCIMWHCLILLSESVL